MGHACVAFNGRMWVLGGWDENGNCLADVWSWDGQTVTNGQRWQQQPNLPAALCMLTAAVYQKQLWIYGGANAPFGAPQTSLWSTADPTQPWGQPVSFTLNDGTVSPDPGLGA